MTTPKSPKFSGSSFRYSDTLEKTAAQLSVVSTAPFSFQGKSYEPPKGGLQIGASFWRSFECVAHCSGCCRNFTLDYLPHEVDNFKALYPLHSEMMIVRIIQSERGPIPVYTLPPGDGIELYGTKFCQFVDPENGYCTIHEANPWSCRVEPIKFRRHGDKGYLLKSVMGRAWNMMTIHGERGAKTEVDKVESVVHELTPKARVQFIEGDLPALKRMNDWGVHFGVQTWLPEVIDKLQEKFSRNDFSTIQFGG